MSHTRFPFTALVGLDALKLALQLAAVDRRLSILLRGDKGAGKSTAARALGDLLDDVEAIGGGGRFVDLPIGATEDRVLGGLDVERAIKGEPALKPGLLAAAHGGVLYIDEVNLLPDHLADTMLDAVASGMLIVEREGFSLRQETRFVLVGSMNPEEGALRPQLLDRFALVADALAPMDPSSRRLAVERRLAFDADPEGFVRAWRAPQDALRARLRDAQAQVVSVALMPELLDLVSARVCAHGVRSLRADLAIVRASRALAAIEGASAVEEAHVEAVLPLALAHRVAGGHATLATALPRGGLPRGGPPTAGPPPLACSGAAPPTRADAPRANPPPSRSPSPLTRRAASDGEQRGAVTMGRDAPAGGLRDEDGADGIEESVWEGPVDRSECGDDRDDDRDDSLSDRQGDRVESPAGADRRTTMRERVFDARDVPAPRLVIGGRTSSSSSSSAGTTTGATRGLSRSSGSAARAAAVAGRGPVLGSRQSDHPIEVDLRSSMRQAVSATGRATPRREDLHEKVRASVTTRRFLFVVDASGSLAAQQRMRLVKGAIAGLLDTSLRRRDEVAVIAFRGVDADVVVPPTTNLEEARVALGYLPTGGRTPLAHGLALAAGLVTEDTALILLTDGRANVSLRTEDPWADALEAASHIACPALVIDSTAGPTPSERVQALAERMRATAVALDALDDARLLDLVSHAHGP